MGDEGPLVPPRPDPHDPAMEARVARLEGAITEISSALMAIRQDAADSKAEQKTIRQEVAALVGGLNSLRQDVTKLAQDVTKLTQDVTKLTQDVTKLTVDLARIDGRVSQMPTLIQLITVVVAIWGMAFATLRFAGH
jgi:chromosome segregation ATPase